MSIAGILYVMANYFTGMKLSRTLYDKGFYAIGTIRGVRKEFPEDLKKKA